MSNQETLAIVTAYDNARAALVVEAVAIVEAQSDMYPDGRMGPAGAVSLVMSALWHDPSLVPALADYFRVLERTRRHAWDDETDQEEQNDRCQDGAQ